MKNLKLGGAVARSENLVVLGRDNVPPPPLVEIGLTDLSYDVLSNPICQNIKQGNNIGPNRNLFQSKRPHAVEKNLPMHGTLKGI
jgi:hypothetical protein